MDHPEIAAGVNGRFHMDNHTGTSGTGTLITLTARGLDLITGTVGFLKGPRDDTLVTGPSDPAAGYALLREAADRGLALGNRGQRLLSTCRRCAASRPPTATGPASTSGRRPSANTPRPR